MKPITDAEEALIRQRVRRVFNEEGRTDAYKDYPAPSIERMVAIDEGSKIEFSEIFDGH